MASLRGGIPTPDRRALAERAIARLERDTEIAERLGDHAPRLDAAQLHDPGR